MMPAKTTSSLRLLLAAVLFSCCSGGAYAQEAGAAAIDAGTAALQIGSIVSSIEAAQEMLSQKREAMFDSLNKALSDATDSKNDASITLEKSRYRKDMDEMAGYDRLKPIAQERAISGILTDDTRRALDDVNYKALHGYRDVANVGLFGKDNPYLHGNLSAAGKLFELHVNLFCNPEGMDNPPDGCGSDRARAGIQGNENFVDFLLSDRTWPKAVVLDTMQLARGYFFEVRNKFSLSGLSSGTGGFLDWQQNIATNSLHMSMLNFLAARRAPTSMATKDVLEIMLQNFALNGSISSTNYEDICSKDKPDNYLEAYACNMTNIPEKAGQPRIMGQAAIDRIMQHDFYLSPLFYNSINSPNDPSVSMERMKVFMMAQQLTQDYYFLRMLQMKTTAAALGSAGP